MRIESQATHAGQQPDSATGALTPPIMLSTTFERDAGGTYPLGYSYSRERNPNRQALERAMSELEGGVDCAAFSSGSAAAMTLFQALEPGDHVIAPLDFYYGIRLLLHDVFMPWGLEVTFADMSDLDAVRGAVRENTRLMVLESPSNPMMQVADLAALADTVHGAGAYLACDNTVATPVLQQPLSLGADFVVHATTKYLGGHSDVLGGLVIAREETPLWTRVRHIQHIGGAVPSPFECWLAMRGLQTLPYRVRAQAASALLVAHFLEGHEAVERVRYPGLESHSGHDIARKQMSGYGGLLSFQVRGGAEEALTVAASVRLFTRATSFGGTHSLIEHRASMEAPGTKTPQNLLRLSIGLEHVEDLIEDLAGALGG